jgi:hypothetical protein
VRNRLGIVLIAILTAVAAPAAAAQEPREETPSLTTEDVRGPDPIVSPAPPTVLSRPGGRTSTGAPSLDEVWGMIYQGLAREGMPAGDVEQFRSTIEGGGEIGFGVRFDIDEGGMVRNLTVTRWSGIAWLDRQWNQRDVEAQITSRPIGRELASFRDVTLDVGVGKDRFRLSGSATAPSEEKAIEAERQLRSQSAGAGFGMNAPGVTVSRTGHMLSASVDVSFSQLFTR